MVNKLNNAKSTLDMKCPESYIFFKKKMKKTVPYDEQCNLWIN